MYDKPSIPIGSHVPASPMHKGKAYEDAIEHAKNHMDIDLHMWPSEASYTPIGQIGSLTVPDQLGQRDSYNPDASPFKKGATNQPFAGNLGRALQQQINLGTTYFSPYSLGVDNRKFFFDLLEHRCPATYAKFMENGGTRNNPRWQNQRITEDLANVFRNAP